MKVLVACEFSGVVREAFRKRGHDAWSCDLESTEQEGPHYKGDAREWITLKNWDLLIAHPPCTYLCRQSNRWNTTKERQTAYHEAVGLFLFFKHCSIDKICIENPIPHKKAKEALGDYTQIIQPYQYGHDYSKKTCLWLKNLPKLKPTKEVGLTYYTTPNGNRYTSGWYFTPRNSKARSRTFQGIADAMADQWGKLLPAAPSDSGGGE